MSNKRKDQNLLQGQAGVHRVATELLLRGINVWFPTVDTGVDLIAEGSVRIQIKSARLRYQRTVYPEGAYWFKLTHGAIVKGGGVFRRGPRNFSAKCDFVVLWGVDQDRFFVVPARDLDGVQCIVVGPPNAWKELDMDEIRALRGQGLTQSQVAEKLGVQQMTISNREREAKGFKRNYTSTLVRKLEGRWDLIEDCLLTLNEANDIAVAATAPAEGVLKV